MKLNKDNETISNLKIYLWCLSFLKTNKLQVFSLLILGAITAYCELYVPKIIQKLLDNILPSDNLAELKYALIIMSVLFVIKFIGDAISQILKVSIQEKAINNIQSDMLRQLYVNDILHTNKLSNGEILTLFTSEVAALQKLYRYFFPELIRSLIFGTIALYFLFNLSLMLSLVIIPCFLAYYLIGPTLDKKSSHAAKMYSKYQLKLGHQITEDMNSIKEIKLNHAQEWIVNKTESVMDENLHWNKQNFLFSFLRGSIRRFSYHLGAIALFIIGYFLIINNQITIGKFIAFLLIYFNTMWRLTRIITMLVEQNLLMYRIQRLYFFLFSNLDFHKKNNLNDQNYKLSGEINLKNVSLHIDQKKILNDINLEIKKGEKVAIVGKSGSGKSTLLSLFSMDKSPSFGEIYFDQVSTKDIDKKDAYRSMAILYQNPFYFNLSIKDNINFADLHASNFQILNAIKSALLEDVVKNHPEDSLIGENGSKLSDGQRQRVALARVFLKNSNIIILDEPTSSLDQMNERKIFNTLINNYKESTVIMVTHNLSSLKTFDKIILLSDGEICEYGDYKSLYEKRGHFYQLLNKKSVIN
ncbi:ABC transporter ATP-binding protein [Exiguobacterium sp. ERU656]|uniref:ABC transporter ATP-binding protein n=1 Tax=Exiguobacterium sp. ERU656 TaxID=2751217 RepID=UPI001BEC02C7|nr:ABC transporter ATP-binding protein [Exiguobacterium sp. ERU656]